MSWSRPKRKVPEPETIGPHRATNPLFPPPATQSPDFRRRVWTATGLILGAIGLALVVIGPWWQIDTVTVAGVRKIDPASVRTVMDTYLNQRRFGIIPNRNLFLLSRTQAANYLTKQIEVRISVEHVALTKLYPRGLHVTVTERTPVAVVRAGDRMIAIDRTGTLIEETVALDEKLPIIDEPIQRSLGEVVFTESVMRSIQELDRLLKGARIETQSWKLPIVTCPAIPETLEIPTEPELENNNTNADANLNTNTNRTSPDINASNTNRRTRTLHQECDDQALAETRPEIHAQVKDGPNLLFDRFQPLDVAVQSVRRILAEPNPPTIYIDVRFGTRVFVQ